MPSAISQPYQDMLQRLSQLASGAPGMPAAPPIPSAPPVSGPLMAPDQLVLSPAAQTPSPPAGYPAYATYPAYPQPYPQPFLQAFPQASPQPYPVAYPAPAAVAPVPAQAPVAPQAPAPSPGANPLGVEWVGASAPATPSSSPANTALGVVWAGTSIPAPAPASSNPLGVDWATAPTPTPAPTPAPAPAPAAGTYTVKSGDTLAKIAQQTLEDANRWREIFDLNRDQLSDPSLIRPGQQLKLPGSSQAAPAPPAAPSTPTIGSRAVAEARKYLGVPYVWGGASPKGFDCSGLMQYVFRALGVSIPRVASDQFRAGREVSRGELQPGDAVFFKNTGSRTGITHVGMYIGDGKFLHAPKTGDVVKIANLSDAYYQAHYAGAKRYG